MKLLRKEMSKTVRAKYTVVLEALKAHACIAGYTIVGNDVIPEWKDGAISQAVHELKSNPKPFGLKTTQRGWLVLVLPQKEQERIGAGFIRAVKNSCRSEKSN